MHQQLLGRQNPALVITPNSLMTGYSPTTWPHGVLHILCPDAFKPQCLHALAFRRPAACCTLIRSDVCRLISVHRHDEFQTLYYTLQQGVHNAGMRLSTYVSGVLVMLG